MIDFLLLLFSLHFSEAKGGKSRGGSNGGFNPSRPKMIFLGYRSRYSIFGARDLPANKTIQMIKVKLYGLGEID